MNKPAALLLVLLPCVVTAQDVTFSSKPPGAGKSRTETKSARTSMKMEVKQGGQVVQTHEIESTEKDVNRVSILECDGEGKPTRVEVAFQERTKKEVQNGMPMEGASPVAGKTFQGTFADGAWTVTCGGEPAAEGEAEEVQEELKRTRETPGVSEFFAGKTVSPGQTLDLPAEAAQKILALDEEEQQQAKITRCAWTLKETKDGPGFRTAVFDVEMTMSFDQPGVTMTFTLKGSCELGVENLWPVHLVLEGPIEISGENPDQGVTIGGGGSMKLDMGGAYEDTKQGD